MALDLQSQEELENAKRAWKLWGRWVFGAAFVLAILYFGNNLFKNYRIAQDEKAADILVQQFLPAFEERRVADTLAVLQKLQQEHGKSVAAAQAAFLTAASDFEAKKYDEAAAHLQWILQHHKQPLIRIQAMEQLAVVYMQQQKYSDAITVLNQPVEAEFIGRIAALRGDIHLAAGEHEAAEKAYRDALNYLPINDPAREFIEAKIRL